MLTSEQIKAAREGLGESQAAFAKRFGVDQSVVSRWETKGVPHTGTAEALIRRILTELPISENNQPAASLEAPEGIP